MGYCISLQDQQFRISAENKPMALAAMRELVAPKENRRQGFAWIPIGVVSEAPTLESAMEEWRYTPEVDANGNITSLMFEGENLGDEFLMFRAIAPFVDEGSFLEISGEDGGFWRWVFNGKDCREISPEITWPKD